MTVDEALRALHLAGRIRSPWLPGMRTDRPHWRAYLHGDGLAGAGEPAGYVADWELLFGGSYPIQRQPDLTDPATVGCLAALAREAVDDPQPMVSGPSHPERWAVFRDLGDGLEEVVQALTEGEAWAAVLVALAEGVSGG